MPIKIKGSTAEIINALNLFHHIGDENRMMDLAGRAFSTEPLTDISISHMANVLHEYYWGRHFASIHRPRIKNTSNIKQTLSDVTLHNSLNYLVGIRLEHLEIKEDTRLILGSNLHKTEVKKFDEALVFVLGKISHGFFLGNRSISPPMIVTAFFLGLSPHFSNTVISGLARAGLGDFEDSFGSIPKRADCSQGRKITRLPFVLGNCWNDRKNQSLLLDCVAKCNSPPLFTNPETIFEALLSGQGESTTPLILAYDSCPSRWFDIR